MAGLIVDTFIPNSNQPLFFRRTLCVLLTFTGQQFVAGDSSSVHCVTSMCYFICQCRYFDKLFLARHHSTRSTAASASTKFAPWLHNLLTRQARGVLQLWHWCLMYIDIYNIWRIHLPASFPCWNTHTVINWHTISVPKIGTFVWKDLRWWVDLENCEYRHLCQIGDHYRQGRLVLAGVSSVRTNWPNYAEWLALIRCGTSSSQRNFPTFVQK